MPMLTGDALQQAICQKLDALQLEYRMIRHEAVFTMEQTASLHIDGGTRPVKNLFLRDHKHRYYLVSMDGDKMLSSKALRKQIGVSSISFATDEQLFEQTGLHSGAVSPLSLINDEQAAITFILDAELRDDPLLAFHPGINTATVFLTPDALNTYLEDLHIQIRYFTL